MVIRQKAERIVGLRNLLVKARSLLLKRPGNRPAPDSKIIFLHIPKTAGTSLRQIVSAEYSRGRCLYIYSHHHDFMSSAKKDVHAARAVYGHVSFGIHDILGIDGRYVAFLRDPVARVMSFYRHQARNKDSAYYSDIRNGMSVRQMLESGICHQMNNHMVRIISGHEGVQMVHDTIWLEKALSNIETHFAFVGLVERMAESIAVLARKLKFKDRHTIPHRNVDRRSHPQKIAAGTLEAIQNYNRLDLKLYEHVRTCFPV